MDEPWAEGEEGGDSAQRTKDISPTTEDADRPNESVNNEDTRVKSEESGDNQENDEGMSPNGAPDEQGNAEEVTSGEPTVLVKTEPIDETRKSETPSNTNTEESSGGRSIKERKVGNMEQQNRKRTTSRSRGSNVGDSSELEASETEETDDRRNSSRRDQDCGRSSRSRTPDRLGSDFGGSPGPFPTHQQQQQFLQAGIPYLHLLPPHIRNGMDHFPF